MAEKLTVFQKLGKLFGPEGPRVSQPTYNLKKKGYRLNKHYI